MNAVATNLIRERERRGLTRSELARMALLHPRRVSEYEAGTRNPKYPSVSALARALGVPIGVLAPQYDPAGTAPAHQVCDYCASASDLLKDLCRRWPELDPPVRAMLKASIRAALATITKDCSPKQGTAGPGTQRGGNLPAPGRCTGTVPRRHPGRVVHRSAVR